MDNNGKNNISYSQISMYNDCNYRWYLSYVKRLRTSEQNIHLLFGTSCHFVLQEYLTKIYSENIKDADSIDLNALLKKSMIDNFTEYKNLSGKDACTKEELLEFYMDGVAILDFFKKNRNEYFSKRGFELIGCEIPLQAKLQNNIYFNGFIDIAIRDCAENRIKIIDFKTSTYGWKDYQKRDTTKTSQLVLYKKFYSELYNIPIENIDVEFIILKRKLYENSEYVQKRIQRFVPASGTATLNQLNHMLNEFISACFTEDGLHNDARDYKKASDSKKCKYCEHYKKNCEGISANG